MCLDPRFKFHIVNIWFLLIYKPDGVAKENIENMWICLRELYNEYVVLSKEEASSNKVNVRDSIASSTSLSKTSLVMDLIALDLLCYKEEILPMKSKLDVYLEDNFYICDGDYNSFGALEWWGKMHKI